MATLQYTPVAVACRIVAERTSVYHSHSNEPSFTLTAAFSQEGPAMILQQVAFLSLSGHTAHCGGQVIWHSFPSSPCWPNSSYCTYSNVQIELALGDGPPGSQFNRWWFLHAQIQSKQRHSPSPHVQREINECWKNSHNSSQKMDANESGREMHRHFKIKWLNLINALLPMMRLLLILHVTCAQNHRQTGLTLRINSGNSDIMQTMYV